MTSEGVFVWLSNMSAFIDEIDNIETLLMTAFFFFSLNRRNRATCVFMGKQPAAPWWVGPSSSVWSILGFLKLDPAVCRGTISRHVLMGPQSMKGDECLLSDVVLFGNLYDLVLLITRYKQHFPHHIGGKTDPRVNYTIVWSSSQGTR